MPAYLEFEITVFREDFDSPITTPPMFNGSVDGFSQTLDLNDNSTFEEYQGEDFATFLFELPEIYDRDFDMCSISFLSDSLGFTYWTNTTNNLIVKTL